jgi:hypothetical protein
MTTLRKLLNRLLRRKPPPKRDDASIYPMF